MHGGVFVQYLLILNSFNQLVHHSACADIVLYSVYITNNFATMTMEYDLFKKTRGTLSPSSLLGQRKKIPHKLTYE